VNPAPVYVLATRSVHKQREIQDILRGHARIITLDQAGIPATGAEEGIEAFETFRENALAKARYFHHLSGIPAIADDSGIMFDALGGAPGVRSRRFSNRSDLDGTALDLANNALAVEKLRDVPAAERTAHYMCVAALVMGEAGSDAATGEHVAIAVGSCSGLFVSEPRGDGGFGYDPHFLLPAIGRTFGELSLPEKHRFSHRARAFRALAPALR
jgi:XTP/dITP diphosphohydrolase